MTTIAFSFGFMVTPQTESRSVAAQHGFYARLSAHLPYLVARAGLGRIARSSDIVRFV